MVTSRFAVQALQPLHDLTQTVSAAQSVEEIFEASLRCLATGLGVERSSILLFDDAGVMRFRAWRALSDGYRAAVEGHSPWANDDPAPLPVLVPDVQDDPDLGPLMDVLRQERIRSVAFIPLVVAGRLIGKFMLYYVEPHDFIEEEVLTAQVIAAQIAFAIDKQRAYAALSASEERYRALVEGMGVAAYTTDAVGRITYYNEEAAAVWGRRPVVGRDLWCGSWRLYWPDGRPMSHSECPMAVALREARPVRDVEILVAQPDGSVVAILPFPTPLRNARGMVIGGVNVLMDITQRNLQEAERLRLLEAEQQAREQAEAAVRARDEFLSIASHELRNPVAGLKGTAQLLQRLRRDGRADAPRAQEYVEALVQTSDRLAHLLDDLLDVARLETGQLILKHEDLDLLALLDEVIAETASTAPLHDLALQCSETACRIHADSVRLREVMVNLLENAVKYSPEGGAITVSVAAEVDEVVVAVTDEGIGFPPSAAEQIFVPFGRAPNATEANIPGMGLGLHISRRLIETHGGTLTATSEGVGRGTRVSLRLPSHRVFTAEGSPPPPGDR
jgi:PAS domain S-box-containing protein